MIKLTEHDLEIIGEIYFGYDHPASEEEAEIWARETLSISLSKMRKESFDRLLEKMFKELLND